jgi:tocopherol O-methyltransferase
VIVRMAEEQVAERPVTVESIREHYDALSEFYRAVWGEHIHQGYWEGVQSPVEAQEKLIARLAERAQIRAGAHVLDVGSGLGGSAIWLAQRGCTVVGVNISATQVSMATAQAAGAGVAERVSFMLADANELSFPPGTFDAVWVIEAGEHLADKPRFIRTCAELLRPGGVLAMCSWLAGDRVETAEGAARLAELSRRLLCPSLATAREYTCWMQASGFRRVMYENITRQVERTWMHRMEAAERPEAYRLLEEAGEPVRRFVETFALMRQAFAEGIMAYGMFTAQRP